jgi:hypothetical protein
LFGDEIRLRERECAAARGNYSWTFCWHFIFVRRLRGFSQMRKKQSAFIGEICG